MISNNIILSAQEAILNRYLNLDSESKEHLHRLSGKVLKIEWGPLTYYWFFKSDSIYLSKEYNGPADLILRGSTFDFLRAVFTKSDKALTDIPLEVVGDMEFAKQFKDFFSNLEIDYEEQLSKIVGDGIAYPMIRVLKAISLWATQSVESLSQNLTNYVQREMNWLVSNEELQLFFYDVDELRDDCARLEARIKMLEKG
ncbi:ubiquinone biosynthesis accessory factor UbiJ [Rickettsiella endosymbiont of Miltochrista miniata]|uniref:ubiquinone biosynthesis accessory factor UbiJ n=1 Tax=Rickettsiella endosymbiont of Miltochrista miniata TaxID=3066239 RepID=UPI00313AB60F